MSFRASWTLCSSPLPTPSLWAAFKNSPPVFSAGLRSTASHRWGVFTHIHTLTDGWRVKRGSALLTFVRLCTSSFPDAEGVCGRRSPAAQWSALLMERDSPRTVLWACSGLSGWSKTSNQPQATPHYLNTPRLVGGSLPPGGQSRRRRMFQKVLRSDRSVSAAADCSLVLLRNMREAQEAPPPQKFAN